MFRALSSVNVEALYLEPRSIAQLLNGMYADGSVGDLNVGFAKAMEP